MKLNKKGFNRILSTCSFDEDFAKHSLKYSDCNKDYFFEIEGVEFEPDDFEDCVVLTIGEAKRLVSKAWLDMEGFACDELLKDIERRIEQAESK